METKIFKANYAGYLATSVYFVVSVIIFIISFISFLINTDTLSGSIFLAAVFMLLLSAYLAFSDLNKVEITENEVVIFHSLSNKFTKIHFDSIQEIDFRNHSSDGPYVDFWYPSPINSKKVRKTITLMSIYPQKKFLLALAEIPTIHTYNGVKADFKDIAKGW